MHSRSSTTVIVILIVEFVYPLGGTLGKSTPQTLIISTGHCMKDSMQLS